MGAERERTIALAALVQALVLVDDLARSGEANHRQISTLLRSLFEFDPENTESIYGRLANLESGLTALASFLQGRGSQLPSSLLDHALSVQLLARRLSRDRRRLKIVRERLEEIVQEQGLDHLPAMVDALGKLYQDTISTDRRRIQVSGSAEFLSRPDVAQLIRALLLSAIRAAILWQQTGGRRWQLLLFPRRYAAWADALLEQSKADRLH